MTSWKVPFAAFFCLSLLLAVTGQYVTGAYASDLHWADEGSHYINGLLIHDYIAHGLFQNPLHYAIGYYANYPKVAIGHWPPFFYPIEAAFLFLAGPSTTAALFLQALIGAALAALVATIVARLHGWIAGALAAVVVLIAPDVLSSIDGVMLDVPLALAAFLATLCWAKYLETDKRSWSLGFAFAASAAILTKGNGFFLALAPPLSLVISGRYDLLKRGSFWLPVPIVGVLTIPWYVATYQIAADGFNYSFGLDFMARALRVYGLMALVLIGVPGLLAAGLGAAKVLQRRLCGWEQAVGVSALSAAVAGFLYHCFVPVALEPRYLVPIVPDLAVLAFFALRWPLPGRYRLAAVCAAAVLIIGAEASFRYKPDLGMGRAAQVVEHSRAKAPFLLVGTTPGGEGAITAEIASEDRDRTQYVLRGFEVLGSGNFMGTQYKPRFTDAQSLKQWIETSRIGWVVLDTSAASLKWGHNRQLQQLIDLHPPGWAQVADLRSPSGSVQIYQVRAGFSQHITVAKLLPQLLPQKLHPH